MAGCPIIQGHPDSFCRCLLDFIWVRCWCLFPPYHRHMRDMEAHRTSAALVNLRPRCEVVVDPSAPSEKEGVHGDISRPTEFFCNAAEPGSGVRSPAGRDVHVGFPALPEDMLT